MRSNRANGAAFHGELTPDSLALIAGSRQITFGELDVRTRRLAHAMRRLGLGDGGVMVNILPTSIEHAEVAVAAGMVDSLPVPLGATWRGDLLATAIAEIRPELVFASDALWSEMLQRNEAFEQIPAILVVDESGPRHCQFVPGAREDYESSLAGCGSAVPPIDVSNGARMGIYRPAADPAGRGKIQELTWEGPALLATRQRNHDLWGWTDGDVALICPGVHHPGPGGILHSAIFAGACSVLMAEWDPVEWLQTVAARRVTRSFLTPLQFKSLLRVPDDTWRSCNLSSLEMIVHGGTPCPASTKMRIVERFAPAEVWEVFGTVDCTVSRISSTEWLDHPGSVGRPLADVDVDVISADGRPVARGHRGIIRWSPAKKGHGDDTHQAAPEGPSFAVVTSHESYVGYLDDDGYLFVTDRHADGVDRNGTTVYPWEVEEVIHGHRDVEDCVVFGVGTGGRDVELVALVQVANGADTEAIEAHCRLYLPDAKCPDVIVATDRVERDEIGKMSRRELSVAYRHSTGVFRRKVGDGSARDGTEHGAGLTSETIVVGQAVRTLESNPPPADQGAGTDLDSAAIVD